uniref:Putative thioredoxin n=1 Tax=Amblyomma triste TaxID=251400 RepID=A0A023GMV7_AMBTT
MAPGTFWCCVLVASFFTSIHAQIESNETNADAEITETEDKLTETTEVEDRPPASEISDALGDAKVNATDDTANSTQSTASRNESTVTNPIRCLPRNDSTSNEVPNRLHLINGTALIQELSPPANKTNTTGGGHCVVVTFYSPYCNFCASAAPYVNALPSGFPDLKFYAVDVVKSSHINMRYGLVAVPSILLFHNGRAVAKFNDTFVTMQGLISFIGRHTGMNSALPLSPDYSGPLADMPLEYTDWVLISAWVFTIVCVVGAFLRSSLCKRMVASVQNAWREAQHQHQD